MLLFNVLLKYNSIQSFENIIVGNISSNTGAENSFIGITNDPKYYKGAIGEAPSEQTLREQPFIQFAPIESDIELFVNSDVKRDFSRDQYKINEYCIVISNGYISERFFSKNLLRELQS